MKDGKNPTISQKKAIAKAGLDPRLWLIVRKFSKTHEMEILHRKTREVKTVEELR